MTELELEIKKYADAYYQGNELISDSDYDALIAKLKKEQPKSELFGNIIGSDLKGVSKKYKLEATMGTLDKCNTDEQMKEWWNKHNHDHLVAELKIDGNGQLLTYKNGVLQYTRSRGDGEYGEDTTTNVKKVNGVIEKLSDNFNGLIRGEIVMLRSTFETYFKDGKNPRNMAAGIIKRLDGSDCDKLQFIAYDVFDDDKIYDHTETEKLDKLKEWGFTVPEYDINPTLESLKKWKDSLDPNGEIPCDGIVIKQWKTDKEDLMRHTPLNNVAYKPNCQSAVTTVKKITWQLKGRYFGPVATVVPVELEGTTVDKASLANVNIMNELGVYEGAEVIMTKHGLIIPQIDKVLNPKKNSFTVPTVCPACGGKVIINDSGIPECVNEGCSRKIAHRLRRMFSVFNIKGAGDVFYKNVENSGITINDFLNICAGSDPAALNKFSGNTNGTKILTQMKTAMATPITAAQYLATFDVKLFDEKKLNQLGNKSLDEIICLKYNDVININGFAETTANALLDFIKNYKQEINDLRSYFTFRTEEKEKKNMNCPAVCFTGACEIDGKKYSRSQLTEMCNGLYDVKDTVTKDLDILVCADPNSGSTKLQKAAKNGTKVISYKNFVTNCLTKLSASDE